MSKNNGWTHHTCIGCYLRFELKLSWLYFLRLLVFWLLVPVSWEVWTSISWCWILVIWCLLSWWRSWDFRTYRARETHFNLVRIRVNSHPKLNFVSNIILQYFVWTFLISLYVPLAWDINTIYLFTPHFQYIHYTSTVFIISSQNLPFWYGY